MNNRRSELLFIVIAFTLASGQNCSADQSMMDYLRSFISPGRPSTEATSEASPPANRLTATASSVSASRVSPRLGSPANQQLAHTSYTQPITSRVAADSIHELTKKDDLFQMVREATGVVVVDFYAPWCGPCRTQSEIVKKMTAALAKSGARVIKVDVDRFPEIASRLKVDSLPTLIVVKNGSIVDRKTGVADQQAMDRFLRY